jgi:biopolymer transport protein ExbD
MKKILLVVFALVVSFDASACAPQKFEADIPPVPLVTPEQVAVANPLTIVIDLSVQGKITLNRGGDKPEEMGTVEDTSRLTDRLKAIFREREREGQEEKTVFIKSPKNIKYGLVVKTIDAAKIAGAVPIGLQVDDIED